MSKVSDGGKGSAPRPYSVSRDKFASNWDSIFGKPEEVDDIEDGYGTIDDLYSIRDAVNEYLDRGE